MLNEAKIQEVFSDEAFVKNLLYMEKPEEVQAALQTKGIDLSLEAIASMKDNLIKKLNGEAVEAPSDEAVTLIAIITVIATVVSATAAATSATVSVASFVDSITQHKW